MKERKNKWKKETTNFFFQLNDPGRSSSCIAISFVSRPCMCLCASHYVDMQDERRFIVGRTDVQRLFLSFFRYRLANSLFTPRLPSYIPSLNPTMPPLPLLPFFSAPQMQGLVGFSYPPLYIHTALLLSLLLFLPSYIPHFPSVSRKTANMSIYNQTLQVSLWSG